MIIIIITTKNPCGYELLYYLLDKLRQGKRSSVDVTVVEIEVHLLHLGL